MLLPMPSLPVQIGPPSEYAKGKRKWLLAILILQSAICICRIVSFLDIMGGFIMAIMIGLGWYAWREDMHMTFLSSWGMLCMINGMFDLVRLVDIIVKTDDPLFSRKKSFGWNFNSVVLILIPISAFLGTALAWLLYREYQVQQLPYNDMNFETRPLNPMSAAAGGGQNGFRPVQSPAFQSFQGAGHKLGTS
eukprot:gnl/TRDRNA2_/TRDRNA2_183328_c0_seq1.p1 gnl/TRDRNA2_/TRDRNA2_183328_c0~~gnl/TRDRNA2_/TRDRNA2_183328_c0_seq1.p1  ORF type:complete len:192 (+),score=39.92 gnl/TRDRNA2_/TRDRNA2_183328_c0_seq1:59-634(+)